MQRFTGPGWRVGGAIGAWLIFAFFFTGLYLGAGMLQGLGGFCATGGPYVIETECPAAVGIFVSLGVPGIFLAAGVAIVLQRGFATPLVVWGWPILFVGLGIQFLMWIPQGAVFVGLLCGILFVVMGLAPLVLELRAGPRRALLGRTNAFDVPFDDREGRPRTIYGYTRVDGTETVAPTPGDWALSLGLTAASIAVGVSLALSAFGAVAVSGG